MMLDILVILSAIPLGYVLAWLGREELMVGRTWFQRLVVMSLALGGGLWTYGMRAGLTLGVFLAILAFIAYCQSFKATWTKSKI